MSSTDNTGLVNAASPSPARLWPGLDGSDAHGAFLNATRCGACGWVMLGARRRCSRCWEVDSLQATSVGRRGRVYSRTVIHAPAPGFVSPYTVAYIDLAEGIRIFAHLAQGDDSPMIGDEVELVIAPLRLADGQPLTGPLYKRVRGGDK